MMKYFMLQGLVFCKETIFTAAFGNSDPVLSANFVLFCAMNYFELLVPPIAIYMWVIPSMVF